MRMSSRWLLAGCCTGFLAVSFASAAETASIKKNTVNVRAQPTTFSEVVCQLKQGDQVAVIEEITLKSPKPDDPAKWVKIKMPAEAKVWVNVDFVDPTEKTVKARKLNQRAGAGENYSVVGLMLKGESFTPVRTANKWIQIEPTTNSYAFVAVEMLNRSGSVAPADQVSNAPEKAVAAVEKPADPAEKTALAEATGGKVATERKAEPLPEEKVDNEPPVVVAKDIASPAKTTPEPEVGLPPNLATPPELATSPAPNPSTNTMDLAAKPVKKVKAPKVEPVLNTGPLPKVPEFGPRRVVIREGTVTSVIMPGPSNFKLVSSDGRTDMDYLIPLSTNMVLKNYKGRKVIVTGEEYLDKRFPDTPIVMMETIQLSPDATR